MPTAYGNAYCIPGRPEAPRCRACAPAAPTAKQVYYKYCDVCGPDTIVYRVELSLDDQGQVSAKEIFKRGCGVRHSRQAQ